MMKLVKVQVGDLVRNAAWPQPTNPLQIATSVQVQVVEQVWNQTWHQIQEQAGERIEQQVRQNEAS